MTACALAFCSAIRSAGYTPAIYANVNQGLLYYGYADKALDEVVFWLAEYGQAPSFEHPFQMWQYADSGVLPGVECKAFFRIGTKFVRFSRRRRRCPSLRRPRHSPQSSG